MASPPAATLQNTRVLKLVSASAVVGSIRVHPTGVDSVRAEPPEEMIE
jgi:hypothetical protein